MCEIHDWGYLHHIWQVLLSKSYGFHFSICIVVNKINQVYITNKKILANQLNMEVMYSKRWTKCNIEIQFLKQCQLTWYGDNLK